MKDKEAREKLQELEDRLYRLELHREEKKYEPSVYKPLNQLYALTQYLNLEIREPGAFPQPQFVVVKKSKK